MEQYRELMRHALEHGYNVPDRTGTGTRAVFGYQMRFDLSAGFPLVTSKRTFWHGAFVEMLWFLRGDTNTAWLRKHGVHIWDEWASPGGELGPIYGEQWVNWAGHVDQVSELINSLKNDPHSRRHIINAWAAHELPAPGLSPQDNADAGRMALAPCHCLAQLHVDNNRQLHCQVYQRSADIFLGVPFNIAGYALLTRLLAHHVGLGVGDLVWTGGDCHLYQNHIGQAHEMLDRMPKGRPRLRLTHHPDTPLHRVEPHHLKVEGYDPHPTIKAEVSV